MIRPIRFEQTILIIFMMLLATGCTPESGPFSFNQGTPTPEATSTPLPTPVAVFQTTISADGQVVLPQEPQVFSFQSSGLSGTVKDIYVVPGQRVKTGDLLAEIDDTNLRNALARAEASLASLEAQIASESAPALSRDLNEARVSLEAAQIELQDLLALPSEEAISQAEADLRLREIELRQAQEAYDEVAFAQGVGLSPQAAELERATLNYERAQATFAEATKPASAAQLAAARSKVVQAENRLAQLEDGLRPEAIAVNEARLRESQLQVEEAKANLAQARLYAPWDGEITAVNGAPGVSIGSATITIARVEPLRFATSNFSERNLADINIGDKATIFLKSYPNVPFPALVQRIALQSTQKDGDTALFTIYFDFNEADFQVQPGMTGRVEISLEPER